MNKWLKNLLIVLAVFSFGYYLLLAILDTYFLGITLLWPGIGLVCIFLVILDNNGKFPKVNKVVAVILGIFVFLFAGYACFNLAFIL